LADRLLPPKSSSEPSPFSTNFDWMRKAMGKLVFRTSIAVLLLGVTGTQASGLPFERFWNSNPGNPHASPDVAWGDVDGDGRLDLVVANANAPNEVYLNRGGELRQDPDWTSSPEELTAALALGDLTGDGNLDLVCANVNRPNTIYVHDGIGLPADPSWATPDSLGTFDVVLGDVDLDGDLDVIFSNSEYLGAEGGPKQLYRNDTTDPNDLILTLVWESQGYEDTGGMALGDLNDDGYLDLVCANFLQNPSSRTIDFGRSVSSAGDVNGDTYDDLMVAERFLIKDEVLDVPEVDRETRVLVFYGGPGMDAIPDIILRNESPGDDFGSSVAPAGDVNNDGFDDVIIGARDNDAGAENAGRAYVYFGGLAPDTVPDLVLTGEATFDRFGASVAGARDVNTDGFDDIIVGAPGNDGEGGNTIGRAYIYYGGSVPDAIPDLVLVGDRNFDEFGTSVAGAGDLNADGFGDVIVGAPLNDGGGKDAGQVYVYYGGASADTLADLILTGEAIADEFGGTVSAAGDVNADTFDDVVVGAAGSDAAGAGAGRAYVYFGGPAVDQVVDLVLNGSAAGDGFGISVSAAGDVNGDLSGDLIVGANRGDTGGKDAGEALVFFGGVALDSIPDLMLVGGQALNNFGQSVSVAGDVDGDGSDDLIVGAPRSDLGGESAGSSYLYLGGPGVDELADLILIGETGVVEVGGRNSVYMNLAIPEVFSAAPTWQSQVQQFSRGVALGDVDGDGDLDAVFANQHGSDRTVGGQVALYRNNGSTLDIAPVWLADTPRRENSASLGDLDKDGDLDLVVGTGNPFPSAPPPVFEESSIFLNNGGTFPGQPDGSLEDSLLVSFSLALGDVDGDGDLDIASANASGTEPAPNGLYLNNQNTWFPSNPTWSSQETYVSHGVALGDLDADGDMDVVFANSGPQTAYFNTAGGLEVSPGWASPTNQRARGVVLGDVDEDGVPEPIFVTDSYGANALERDFGHENDNGVISQETAWESSDRYTTRSAALGDVNGDGRPDLVSVNAERLGSCPNLDEPNTLRLGDGSFFHQVSTWWSDPVRSRSAALGDLEGDGDLDLVSANICAQRNTVYLNNGEEFSTSPDWTSIHRNESWGVALGNVDNDDFLDAVFANTAGDNSLYLNGGTGTNFNNSWNAGAGFATAVDLGDVDGDGDLDVVFGNVGNNELYLNVGQTFDTQPVWSTSGPNETWGIALGDVDGDGDLDVVCANDSQRNTMYAGLRNPLFQGDPLNPTHQLPNSPGAIRFVDVRRTGPAGYRVRLTVVDVDSDPVWVYPEVQIEPLREWRSMVRTIRVGPLTSSPAGVEHHFDWDVSDLPITPGRVRLRFRWTSIPQHVGVIQHAGIYQYDLGELAPRPRLEPPSEVLDFPTVTVGDTASADLVLSNTGNDTLSVFEVRFSSPEIRMTRSTPFVLLPKQSEALEVLLEPRNVLPASDVIQVVTDDPADSVRFFPIGTEILDLVVELSDQAGSGKAPLGQALTIVVSPVGDAVVEDGFLFYRATGIDTTFADSLRLSPVGNAFTATIPAEDVTEAGLDYFVRVENSGVVRREPETDFISKQVETPQGFSVVAQENDLSGYLAGEEVRFIVLMETGAILETGTLFYRQGGSAGGFDGEDFVFTGLIHEAVIPDTAVTARGVEYWVLINTLGGGLLRAPPQNHLSNPLVLQTSVPNLVEPSEHPGESYRMVSFPLEFGAVATIEELLRDQPEFGPYDRTRWRAFWWPPTGPEYIELDDSGEFHSRPGRAYWLISRSPHRVDTSPGGGFSTPTSTAYSVILEPGWNQIGNPFAFPVAWDQVLVDGVLTGQQADAEPPIAWINGGPSFDQAVLVPFEGYWVRNASSANVVLAIPPIEVAGGSLSPRSPALESKAAGPRWQIAVSASAEGVRYDAGRAGVDPEAAHERDSRDRSAPPLAPGRALSVYFPHGDWLEGAGVYTIDLRSAAAGAEAGEDGRIWVLDVAKNFRTMESGDETTLEFDPAGMPEDEQVVLVDRVLDRFVDLRADPDYTFFLGEKPQQAGPETARFELLVGTEAFIQSRREAQGGTPFTDRLFQNYPNPFRTDTMIRYEVAERGPVRLKIFDIQGRLVRELKDEVREPGRYEVYWDGRDGQGRNMAPGIYFYRASTPGLSQTRRMVLIR
jgi:hypothetical protein